MISALFSLFLTPQAVGNAEITIGGTDTSKFTGLCYNILLIETN